MKKHIYTIFFAFISFTGFAQSDRAAQLVKQLKKADDKKIMVVAHRGDWRDAPENSLLAYEYAIKMGVDIIEVDLNITKDGVVVIMHDHTIDRTTDGRGSPSDYTLAELKKFHLKNALGRITDHTIPTLEEVMLVAKGKVLINLDKSYDFYTQACQILKKTGTLNQAIFKTNAPYKDVRKRYPTLLDSICFMPVIDLADGKAKEVISDYQKNMTPVAFELIFERDTSGILTDLKKIKENGARVWVNSLWPSLNGGHDDDLAVDHQNKKDSWDWLIAHGFNMIQTDRPRELLFYLKMKHLH